MSTRVEVETDPMLADLLSAVGSSKTALEEARVAADEVMKILGDGPENDRARAAGIIHAAMMRAGTAEVDRRRLAERRLLARAGELENLLRRQRDWSSRTFGPQGHEPALTGVIDHIEKELIEVRLCPMDKGEYIDGMLLNLDGYWRSGGTPEDLFDDIFGKQNINFKRKWDIPDDGTAPHHVDVEL